MRALILGLACLLATPVLAGCGDDEGDTTTTTASGGNGGDGAMGGDGGGGEGAAGGQGGAGGGMGGGGMGGGGGVMQGPDAVIDTLGDLDKVLLRGLVVTPDQAFEGEVLIEGELITCVAASCSGEPGAATASVVTTNGIIMPGMIDSHNHILFDIFDEDDWAPMQSYMNHNQWKQEARYTAMVDAKQYLNGEGAGSLDPDINCEMNKYGELKGLVAGTTSILGGANPGNKVCYRTVARTIDQTANGLCQTFPPMSCTDSVQVNTIFPSNASANGVCNNLIDGDTQAYVIHIAEGLNQSARDELEDLRTITTTDGCLHDPATVIVHGTAFQDAEFDILAANGMGLSWSPKSNVFLYGGGTDLTATTNIPLALSKGILIGLSPDWSLGGSANLLEELKFADTVDNQQWNDTLSHQDLVEMVTINAAELLSYDAQIGSLEVGKLADVTVVGGDQMQPYASIVAANPRDVRMVFVGGRLLYADDQLAPLTPPNPGCEMIDICGRQKALCVATTGGTASNKWGQTLAEIDAAINQELINYDNLNLTQWDFAPATPLVKCPN